MSGVGAPRRHSATARSANGTVVSVKPSRRMRPSTVLATAKSISMLSETLAILRTGWSMETTTRHSHSVSTRLWWCGAPVCIHELWRVLQWFSGTVCTSLVCVLGTLRFGSCRQEPKLPRTAPSQFTCARCSPPRTTAVPIKPADHACATVALAAWGPITDMQTMRTGASPTCIPFAQMPHRHSQGVPGIATRSLSQRPRCCTPPLLHAPQPGGVPAATGPPFACS